MAESLVQRSIDLVHLFNLLVNGFFFLFELALKLLDEVVFILICQVHLLYNLSITLLNLSVTKIQHLEEPLGLRVLHNHLLLEQLMHNLEVLACERHW